jgi:hypothetical protein
MEIRSWSATPPYGEIAIIFLIFLHAMAASPEMLVLTGRSDMQPSRKA